MQDSNYPNNDTEEEKFNEEATNCHSLDHYNETRYFQKALFDDARNN